MHSVKLILLVAVMIFVSACTSMPRIYSGDEVHGWVVDSKTKEPIEDVVVVIAWELEGGFIHTDHTANIHIAETVTNNKGYYSFESWGPKITVDGRRSSSTPRLVFYKFGYESEYRLNSISGNLNPDNSVSEYTGKNIELVKHVVLDKKYESKLRSINSILQLSNYRTEFDCTWTKIPRFTAEMIKLNDFFKTNGISNNFPSIRQIDKNSCGNRDALLMEYLK